MKKHIILIGFKCVGKSAIGRELAGQLNLNFIDLDQKIEQAFLQTNGQKFTCRQIMLKFGQEAFRQLEHETLKQVLLEDKLSIIASGGGMPMFKANHDLIKDHKVIQIIAPKNIVYERIMVSGRPAFFSPDEHPLESFNRIWNEREKVYNSLTNFKIENSGTIEQAVGAIKDLIK